jgi:phosphoglycolate phosphatase
VTTTGFDLDMTLIDSRPGIKATYDRLVAETGIVIDTELVITRLGPPLELELAHWADETEVPRLADRYRELYPSIALPLIAALPGAREALAAARRGGRAIVITAKFGPSAQLHVDRLGLEADAVFGNAWREGKADVLREQGASTYVGDHVHDMDAAVSSGAFGVGVATGPSSADELRDAGAGVVLDSLTEFAGWFAHHRAGV